MVTPSPAEVLSALANGVDPASGEELDATGIWQQPSGAKLGQPWTAGEDRELIAEFAAGMPLPAIATRHERSLAAIEARLERLGKITAGERVTRNRHTPA